MEKKVRGWVALDHKGNIRRDHIYIQPTKPQIIEDCSCRLPVVKFVITYNKPKMV